MSRERKDGVGGVDRMWDSQWVNVVNAPEVLEAVRNESAEEAVNIAVKLTEQAMAKNIRQLAESRAELLEALRGLYDELERDHYGAGYAPEPDEPMGIAKAALATQQRKEPGA